MENKLDNYRMYPGADCDTDRQLLMVTVKRQRQHSILPLNLEELKEEKAVQFSAEVSKRFTALEAAHDEVTPEDLWKGTKTVQLEEARETVGSKSSRRRKRNGYLMTLMQ